jgi:hypothetical protein
MLDLVSPTACHDAPADVWSVTLPTDEAHEMANRFDGSVFDDPALPPGVVVLQIIGHEDVAAARAFARNPIL